MPLTLVRGGGGSNLTEPGRPAEDDAYNVTSDYESDDDGPILSIKLECQENAQPNASPFVPDVFNLHLVQAEPSVGMPIPSSAVLPLADSDRDSLMHYLKRINEHALETTGINTHLLTSESQNAIQLPQEPESSNSLSSEEIVELQHLLTVSSIHKFHFDARVRQVSFSTYNKMPACLVIFEVNFQRESVLKGLRLREATIGLVFEGMNDEDQGSENFAMQEQIQAPQANLKAIVKSWRVWKSLATLLGKRKSASKNTSSSASCFQYTQADPDITLEIAKFSPTNVSGKVIRREQTLGFSANATAASISLSMSRSISEPREGQQLLLGCLRGQPPRRIEWKLFENKYDETGIQGTYKLAVIILHDSQRSFSAAVEISGLGSIKFPGLDLPRSLKGDKRERIIFKPGVSHTRPDTLYKSPNNNQQEDISKTSGQTMNKLRGGSIEVSGKTYKPRNPKRDVLPSLSVVNLDTLTTTYGSPKRFDAGKSVSHDKA